MVRLLNYCLFAATIAPVMAIAQDDAPGRQQFTAGVELGYLHTSGYDSWTGGSASMGKLRHDEGDGGITLSRAFFDYTSLLTDTIDAHVAVELYDDDFGESADFTEAYLEWRPLPRSANRYRLKVGAFYPRLSLENTEPGWSSPYTLNSSAINTWVAEELRTFGAELGVTRRPRSLGGAHQFGLHVAAFYGSDPAGTILAWRGWALHDRQTRFADDLPLPPLPQLRPGGFFERNDPFIEPFLELDNKAGFYVGGEWRYTDRVLVRAMHYDNRADPEVLEDGQYGWTTIFDHVGAQFELPADFGLIAQWMSGSTVMGGVINGAHVVDVEYESTFLLLTRTFERHRLTLRYDRFDVTQNDQTVEDNNPENGSAWTIGYRYRHSDRIGIAAEWLAVRSHRCARGYAGIDPDVREEQIQLSLLLRFAN